MIPFPASAQGQGAPASEPTDTELVERARRDDMTAWALLYRRHFRTVFRHVMSLTGKRAVAEDLTQEAFARGLVAIRSFDQRSTFRTWLHGVALNLVRVHHRSRQRAERARDQLKLARATQQLVDGGLEHQQQRKQRAQILHGLLDRLSPALREAFALRYLQGLSVGEAAERLGVEAGTLRVRAHRAREKLEADLAQLGLEAAAKRGEL